MEAMAEQKQISKIRGWAEQWHMGSGTVIMAVAKKRQPCIETMQEREKSMMHTNHALLIL